MAKSRSRKTPAQQQGTQPRLDEDTSRLAAGGGGSNDVTSGGGNASGIPDADLGMRGDVHVNDGDVEKDREKLFPDAPKKLSKAGEDEAEAMGHS
jgi:hypothetical protein